jgi:MtrB/PioB family decaheme-associated outer membrane protein
MTDMQRTFKLTALSIALAGAYGFAQAQEPTGSISAGLGYWSDERPRWGVYDGMNEEGGYLLLDGTYRKRDDATGTWLRLDASNLGLDNREIRGEWERQGNMGLFLEYSRTPREDPNTYLTGVTGIGTATLRVPFQASGIINPTRSEVHLGTVRDRVGAGFLKHFGGGYDFRVTFSNEDKTGTRLWGRGGAAEFAVEPIDSVTRQLEAVLSYTGRAFQVQGGYYGSWYTNNINSMVDTAYTTLATATQYFLSLPLDNQAHKFFANGGYNFTPATRATFKAAYTRATQDETIPLGYGAGFPTPFAGAPTHLDGRLDNTLLQAGLTSRTSNTFSWLASVRYYESKEKTPEVRVIQTNPACGVNQCVDNTPLTFKTTSGKLEGTYRMMPGLSLMAGVEYATQDRNVPVGTPTAAGDLQRWVPWRAEIDETTYRLQLRRSLSETINGSLGYAHSKRDGSDFTVAQADPTTANLINPIHLADRDRDRVRLMVDWTPAQPLTLTFNAEYAKDEYGHSDTRPYGLREGEASLYSLDAAYAITDRWQVSAWYARDNTKATQINQRLPDVKEAHLEDIGDNFGVGLSGQLMPALKAGFDVFYSKNVNKYPETITPSGTYPAGTAGPLPDITNELTRFKLYAVYAVQKNADVRIDYIHERWETDDWSWYFADRTTPFTYGTNSDGTTVIQAPKQTSDFVGVRYIYRFQ